MTKMKCHSDELWTSYLVRRLKTEGVFLQGQSFEKTEHRVLDYRTGKCELQVSVYTPNSIISIKKSLPGLEEHLRKNTTYGGLRESVIELDEEVDIVECGALRGHLSLKFLRTGSVEVKHHSVIPVWPIAQYRSGTARKARDVIDDIVNYIKEISSVRV